MYSIIFLYLISLFKTYLFFSWLPSTPPPNPQNISWYRIFKCIILYNVQFCLTPQFLPQNCLGCRKRSHHSHLMWHFTVLISLAQGYHDSDAALLTSVSVISATISSSLKTRISKSSDPTRSWKGKVSHIVGATYEHSRISIDKAKTCMSLYTLLLLPESFNLPRTWYSGRFLPLGKSPDSVSEEKVATTNFIHACGLHVMPEHILPPSSWKHALAQCPSLPVDRSPVSNARDQ